MPRVAADRRSVAGLPTSTQRWEVGLIDLPIRIEGVDTEGMLIVAEQDSGDVRAAGPIVRGEDLWPVLREAFLSPAPPCTPARPRAVCTTPALAARLRRELEGTKLQVEASQELPRVQQVFDAFVRHVSPLRAPGMTRDFSLWAQTLSLLCQVAPWRELPDRLAFRFESEAPELASGVAVVLGLAGEQEGVVLYRSEGDFARMQGLALAQDVDAAAQIEALCLYIDPIEDLSPAEQKEVRHRQLELPGGRAPRLLALQDGNPGAPTERQQQILLAAVEAVVRLCLTELKRLRTEARSVSVSTCLGRVTAHSRPPDVPIPSPGAHTLASDVAHAVILTRVRVEHDERPPEELEAVVLKMTKRDAQKLAARVASTDTVLVEPLAKGVRLTLFEGSRPIGVLCEVPAEPDRVQRLASAPTLALSISAGGPKRHQVRNQDVVLSLRVAVRPAGAPAGALRHDPIFDRPHQEWPKISDTLIRFVQAALGPMFGLLEPKALPAALQMASTVWNAVVLADFAQDAGPLADLQRRIGADRSGPFALVEALLAAKRQHFPGDPRLIGNVEVSQRGGQPWIRASTALPSGYKVGSSP
jgi:hypothetical protein